MKGKEAQIEGVDSGGHLCSCSCVALCSGDVDGFGLADENEGSSATR